MCTYATTTVPIRGSAKFDGSWAPVEHAVVYFDHPVHAPESHTLNLDLRSAGLGPGARIAVELDAESARRLAEAILDALAATPRELTGLEGGSGVGGEHVPATTSH